MTTEPLVRPGPIGRGVRIVAGVVLLAVCLKTLSDARELVGFVVPPAPAWWAGVGASFWLLAGVVNRGFGRAWGRWPQGAFVGLALAAVVFNLVRSGAVWGPPLGFLVFGLLAYVTGHLGVSFVVAGLSATPG